MMIPKIYLLFFLKSVFSEIHAIQDVGYKNCPQDHCPGIFDLVCAQDGQTYLNRCSAKCNGQDILCDGECPCRGPPPPAPMASTFRPCPCPKIWSPVCSTTNATYSNDCVAKCQDEEIECDHECPCKKTFIRPPLKPCGPVPLVLMPVCSKTNITYDNSEVAKCYDEEIECHHECPCKKTMRPTVKPCRILPLVRSPVCSTTNITYVNRWHAKCHDEEIACGKECPCEDDGPPAKLTTSKPCLMPKIWRPVCSTTNRDYVNEWEAKCYGEEIACMGECPCKAIETPWK